MPAGPCCATIAGMSIATSLYLAPLDPDAVCDRNDLEGVLHELGIIGDRHGPASYRAGPGFARHVVFAGCSPRLVVEPPRDGGHGFCHVALHGPFERPRLVTGPNTRAPRCPACRAGIDDWRRWLDGGPIGAQSADCRRCGRRTVPQQLDWRQQAAVGRVLVELRNVFPGEGMPDDRLMAALHACSGSAWRYAWAASLFD